MNASACFERSHSLRETVASSLGDAGTQASGQDERNLFAIQTYRARARALLALSLCLRFDIADEEARSLRSWGRAMFGPGRLLGWRDLAFFQRRGIPDYERLRIRITTPRRSLRSLQCWVWCDFDICH